MGKIKKGKDKMKKGKKGLVFFVLMIVAITVGIDLTGCSKSDDKKVDSTTKQKETTTTVDQVNAITSEWEKSPHGTPSPDEDQTVFTYTQDKPCEPCHNGNALAGDGTYKSTKNVINNPNDTTNNKMYNSKTAELPTTMGCATCHSGLGAQIMDSGVIPAAQNTITSLLAEWDVGNQNALCFTCHNGRRDVEADYAKWTGATASSGAHFYEYPHHGWNALVTGKGVEYPGVKYPQNDAHMKTGCVGCHMVQTADGYVSHNLKPNTDTCKKCHGSSVKNFEDFSKKSRENIEKKLETLKPLIFAKAAPVFNATKIVAWYAPLQDASGKEISEDELKKLPGDVLIAIYNYTIVEQEIGEGGKGIHNPKYANALLDESIKRLK